MQRLAEKTADLLAAAGHTVASAAYEEETETIRFVINGTNRSVCVIADSSFAALKDIALQLLSKNL